MSINYDLVALQQNAINKEPGAFKALLSLFQELYQNHEDEHEIVGSFLLGHISELIPVIAQEIIVIFSIDDPFDHYDYLFDGFSNKELMDLEMTLFELLNDTANYEVLNYEVLKVFFERGVFSTSPWKDTLNQAVDLAQKRCSSKLNGKLSFNEYISFCKLSIMGIEYYLIQQGVTSESNFEEWKNSQVQSYKMQLEIASNTYIQSLKKLIAQIE